MPARPTLSAIEPNERADQIFAAILDGQTYAEIAAAEGVGVRRIQQIVRDTLVARAGDSLAAYKHIQIVHIESALRLIEREIAAGKLSAVPYLLKVLPLLAQLTSSGLNVGGILGSDDPRIDRFTGALDQLEATREVVSARLSRKAVREKLTNSGNTLAQTFGTAHDSWREEIVPDDKFDV